MQRHGIAGIVIVIAVVVLAGCSAPPPPTVAGPPEAGLAKLDASSRTLLQQLDTGEWARAELSVTDSASIRRLAAQLGLQVPAGSDPATVVSVLGPPAAILRLGADSSIGSITLHEDDRALRPVAAAPPQSAVLPVPGRPYGGRFVDVPIERRTGEVSADRRAAAIAALSAAILTVDGNPYADVESVEGCEPQPVSCLLSLTGRRDRANLLAGYDIWSAKVEAGGAVSVTPQEAGAMPRWLAREAERVARSSTGNAPARIAVYATISAFRWTADPLRIDVFYVRRCEETARAVLVRPMVFNIQLADTGDCFDLLQVTVDPARGTVTNLTERAGP